MADSTLNYFVGTGTAAEMGAFTPSPPSPSNAPPAQGYVFFNTDDATLYAWDGANWVATNVPATGGGLTWIEEATPSATGVVTFSSLGSFTHLEIRYSGRSDQVATSTNINLTFNGDTGSNYDRQTMSAVATTQSSSESLGATSMLVGQVAGASAPSGATGGGNISIEDYRNTTLNKSVVSLTKNKTATSSGGVVTRTIAGEWRSTAAITSITLTLASGNYVTGSKFTLYGLQ